MYDSPNRSIKSIRRARLLEERKKLNNKEKIKGFEKFMNEAAKRTRIKCPQTREEVAPLPETPSHKRKQTDLEGTIKTNYLMTEKPVPDDESIELLREWLNAPDALENPKFEINKPKAEMCRFKYMPMALK